MRQLIKTALVALFLPSIAVSDSAEVVDHHILPGYATLAATSLSLAETSTDHCAPDDAALRDAFGHAFDAWVAVSHLRFGPSEVDDRAFALAFWPDPRGSTPKALGQLMRNQDPAGRDPVLFQDVSIAARGFYALEFLLYDPQFASQSDYGCDLVRTLTTDIAQLSGAILSDWQADYAALLRAPGTNETYRSQAEAQRQLFTALSTGLAFTAETRLGRPLGSYDRPRPLRAEARRSNRALRHVILSLQATRALASHLSDGDPALDAAFAKALARASALDDPALAGTGDPAHRFQIEALQQDVNDIRQIVAEDLGPRLGITAGFNALDGD